MVAVNMDRNYIDVVLMKLRETGSLIEVYQTICSWWKATGVASPNWHIMDNEGPNELKQAIKENGCTFALMPSIFIN
jgi:hypothetical protein